MLVRFVQFSDEERPCGAGTVDLVEDGRAGRGHGIAPVHRSHPAYRYMRDGDGDGVVCE